MSRYNLLSTSLLILLLSGCNDARSANGVSVLFVGNSLTYYYGTPYLLSVLNKDSNFEITRIEGRFKPGGTLINAVMSQGFLSNLSKTSYDFVFVQEQGGLLLCGASLHGRETERCKQSLKAHEMIIGEAREVNPHVKSIMLGTTQLYAQVAEALEAGESYVAEKVGFDLYLPLANRQIYGRKIAPHLKWLAPDGVHPGITMNLLKAILIQRIIDPTIEAVGLHKSREYKDTRRIPEVELNYDQGLIGVLPYTLDTIRNNPPEEFELLVCLSESDYSSCT